MRFHQQKKSISTNEIITKNKKVVRDLGRRDKEDYASKTFTALPRYTPPPEWTNEENITSLMDNYTGGHDTNEKRKISPFVHWRAEHI